MAITTRDRLQQKLERLKAETTAIEEKLKAPPSPQEFLHDLAVQPETARTTVEAAMNNPGINGDVNKAASFLKVPVSYIHQVRKQDS